MCPEPQVTACPHPDDCELYWHCVADKHAGRWTDLQGATTRDTDTWQDKRLCELFCCAAVKVKLDSLNVDLTFIKQQQDRAHYNMCKKNVACVSS